MKKATATKKTASKPFESRTFALGNSGKTCTVYSAEAYEAVRVKQGLPKVKAGQKLEAGKNGTTQVKAVKIATKTLVYVTK